MFELIRENNLFTDVQDQVLLLVEFDHELMGRRRKERAQKAGKAEEANGQEKGESEAIQLLVDNIHSIPVCFHPSREREGWLICDITSDQQGRIAVAEEA